MSKTKMGDTRQNGEVKAPKKSKGIPKILLQIVSVECPFCFQVRYSKKKFRTIWRLKCHLEYYHRDEYKFSEVIENLRKGVLP